MGLHFTVDRLSATELYHPLDELAPSWAGNLSIFLQIRNEQAVMNYL